MIEFAHGLAYRRVWIGSEVIDPDPVVGHSNITAKTRCSACHTEFSEDEPEFILAARRIGIWPCRCLLDGSALPQWQLSGDPEAQRFPTMRLQPRHASEAPQEIRGIESSLQAKPSLDMPDS